SIGVLVEPTVDDRLESSTIRRDDLYPPVLFFSFRVFFAGGIARTLRRGNSDPFLVDLPDLREVVADHLGPLAGEVHSTILRAVGCAGKGDLDRWIVDHPLAEHVEDVVVGLERFPRDRLLVERLCLRRGEGTVADRQPTAPAVEEDVGEDRKRFGY